MKKIILLFIFVSQCFAVNTIFNVADFGADLTGGKDSSEAIISAVDFATKNKLNNFCIYLPKGKYLINKQVLLELPYVKNEMGTRCGVTLLGEGIGKTIIKVNNTNGFFWLKLTPRQNQITFNVSDMTILAGKRDSGTAIKFSKRKMGVKPYRQCVFKNLNILGINKNSSFRFGISMSGAWYPIIYNVRIKGSENILNTGFKGHDLYQPIFHNVIVENAVNGIWHHGATDPEDGIIYDCDLLNTRNAIKIFPRPGSDWAEPGFHVWDSKIQYKHVGVWVNGARQTFINKNSFYRLPTKTRMPKAVWYEHSSQGICDANEFTSIIKDKNNIFIKANKKVGYIYSYDNNFFGYGIGFCNVSSNLYHGDNKYTKFYNFSADNKCGKNLVPEKDKYGYLIIKK